MQPDELEQCFDYANMITRKYYRQWHDIFEFDEIQSDALLGFTQALNRFNANHPTSNFLSFARKRIEGAVVDGIRARTGQKNNHCVHMKMIYAESIEGIREKEDKDGYQIPDEYAEKQFETIHNESGKLTKELLLRLTPRERYIVQSYFWADKDLKTIGKVIGLTESRICYIVKGTIAKLRQIVADDPTQRFGRLK